MTPEPPLGKPISAEIKPLDTTDASELDPTTMYQEDIAAKLVLRPWRVRSVAGLLGCL